MTRLAWKIDTQGPQTEVTLSGAIEEEANFAKLQGEIASAQRVRLNLGGVARINSCGVREWVNFIRSFRTPGSVELSNCSPAVVAQLNMIGNFAGSARVLSVLAPYICESCNSRQVVLVDLQKGAGPPLSAVKCGRCGSATEFDDVEEAYFAFLEARR